MKVKAKAINETFIMLISKKDNPKELKDLRPSGLCNVIFRIITKVITNRIKVILLLLESPNQYDFVQGHQGSNNIIVAQGVVRSMWHAREGLYSNRD